MAEGRNVDDEWVASVTAFVERQTAEEAAQFLDWADFRWGNGRPARGEERLRSWMHGEVQPQAFREAMARAFEVVERYVERGCVVCGTLKDAAPIIPREKGWPDEAPAPAVHFCDDCAEEARRLLSVAL
jgi:hypothetical protein